jgi:hypothetical protein
MLQDIQKTMQSESGEWDKAESCYWIANNYWEKLKVMIKEQGFKDDNDEINFFRNVKPRFTSHIEYMMMIAEALLFAPAERKDAIDFWRGQASRVKKFYLKNVSFLIYYHRKDHDHDAEYFLRRNNKTPYTGLAHVYDRDADYSASHDHLIRTYLAYRMFAKFARRKLWILTGRLKAL